jgi:hypothetical protein
MKYCIFAIMSPGMPYQECGKPAKFKCQKSSGTLCEDHADFFGRSFGFQGIEPLMNAGATVAEIITKLHSLPQDLPCYFRPKYHGDVSHFEEVPVDLCGITPMVPPNSEVLDRVVFLC